LQVCLKVTGDRLRCGGRRYSGAGKLGIEQDMQPVDECCPLRAAVTCSDLSYARSSLSPVDDLAGEARRLRREGLSGRQIQERLGVPKQRLQDWLRGVPPPEWTRRPTAKDDLHEQALKLRGQGWSVNDIALELGIARSTAWQWVQYIDGCRFPPWRTTSFSERTGATSTA
jgi:transposase-like protein